MKPMIYCLLIILFISTVSAYAKTDKEITEEAVRWAQSELNNLRTKPDAYLNFSKDPAEKRNDVTTFNRMLKKDVVLCAEDDLNQFNAKLSFVSEKYPIIDLNFICYESDLPGIGFYNRTLLVVSSRSAKMLSSEEFLSATGHELAHSAFTDVMSKAILENDFDTQKLIELKCDVIGLALLRMSGIKDAKAVFVSALNKHSSLLQNANFRKDSYISNSERVKFVEKISGVLNSQN